MLLHEELRVPSTYRRGGHNETSDCRTPGGEATSSIEKSHRTPTGHLCCFHRISRASRMKEPAYSSVRSISALPVRRSLKALYVQYYAFPRRAYWRPSSI